MFSIYSGEKSNGIFLKIFLFHFNSVKQIRYKNGVQTLKYLEKTLFQELQTFHGEFQFQLPKKLLCYISDKQ